jgi:hypothetical protein
VPERHRRTGSAVAGGYQAGLVGEDDGLGAVAQGELGEYPADVGLHGLLGDDEGVGDLGVGQAPGDEFEDLGLARGEAVQAQRRAAARDRALSGAKSAMSRRVTEGASSASPAATTRTAWIRSETGASFSRKPLAPTRSAS